MRKFLFFIVAAMTIAACSQADIDDVKPANPQEGISLTVGFESNDTRIQFNEATKSIWNEGDLVSVFYKGAAYSQWRFMGETGDRTGRLEPVGNVVAGSGEVTVALYPDNADYGYNSSNGEVTATVASEQNYLAKSYGEGGNILVASSTTASLQLKNVYGWLRLDIKGEGESVESITFKGNNNEQLAGDIIINSEYATARFVDNANASESITLLCSEEALDSQNAKHFYIGLVPQTFEAGITIVVETVSGKKMTKSTSNSVPIERRTIQPIAVFDFAADEVEEEWVEALFPATNQVWYNTYSYGIHKFNISQPFDANITKHEFGAACSNGSCYNLFGIDCDADVTTVNQAAFYNSDVEIIYLPNKVTTIASSAFLASANLATVHIGYSIESIGQGAFANCGNLEKIYIRATTPPTLGNYALERESSGAYVYLGSTIYVPTDAVAAYKAHEDWRRYAEYIRGYDFAKGEEAESGSGGGGSSSSSPFNHRLLILDHTGVNCSYCPEATDRLHALANSEFSSYYHEVSIHGNNFAPSDQDPAYSAAAVSATRFYNPNNFPTIYLNFYGGTISRGNSNDEFVNTTMSNIFNANRKKFGADAGIAITTTANNGTLSIDIDVKSAKEQEYCVTAWVLENNIWSPNQNGATTDLHKTYNHALRHMSGEYNRTHLAGDSLGTIAVDGVAEKSYEVTLDNSWVTQNLEVLVIVSANRGDGTYEVVNCALCPVNSTKDYEYLDQEDDEGIGEIGGGDNTGAVTFTTMTSGVYNDYYYFYSYSFTDGGDTSLNLYVTDWYGMTSYIKSCQLNYISQKSLAGGESYFHADKVIVNGVSKKVADGKLLVLNGEMTLDLTFDDSTTQRFLYTF